MYPTYHVSTILSWCCCWLRLFLSASFIGVSGDSCIFLSNIWLSLRGVSTEPTLTLPAPLSRLRSLPSMDMSIEESAVRVISLIDASCDDWLVVVSPGVGEGERVSLNKDWSADSSVTVVKSAVVSLCSIVDILGWGRGGLSTWDDLSGTVISVDSLGCRLGGDEFSLSSSSPSSSS